MMKSSEGEMEKVRERIQEKMKKTLTYNGAGE
jgi:hypothetical protein